MSFLEKTYNTLSKQVQEFNNTWISLLKMIVRYRKSSTLPPIDSDACYILGNGPSLKTSLTKHIDTLKQNDVICVNHFVQSEYFELLKPKRYVLLDSLFFIFNGKEYNREDVRATFEKFKTITWEVNLYVPLRAQNSYFVTELLKTNPNIKICYFNYIVVSGYNWFKFFAYKHRLGMPQCTNVLSTCIYFSINSGYKNVYVFGADHSWHEQIFVLDDNSVSLDYKDFTDKERKPALLKSATDENITISEFFFALHKTFTGYYVLNTYAKYRNSNIYNASELSYIDAFERKQP